ncbi:MAG TPA: hypothetical protein VFV80_03980 [Geminicoccaceae bacterium]|nr:hypothetical protein [Geminicoccaceae bacterium]
MRRHGEDEAAAALPASCVYTIEQVLGDWLPELAARALAEAAPRRGNIHRCDAVDGRDDRRCRDDQRSIDQPERVASVAKAGHVG